MDTIETTTEETPAKPKPAKKKARPRKKAVKRAAAPPPAEKADQFAGLTDKLCCAACNADRCVISGKNYCGHPNKGGLQGASHGDTAAVRRSHEAKKILGRKMLDARFS